MRYKLLSSDEDFLYDIIEYLENGENLERSLILTKSVPIEIKLELQLGMSFEKVISLIKFNYPISMNLLLSLAFNSNEEAIRRIKSTADIIKKQQEALEEKRVLLLVHKRRIKIIRLISTLVIGTLAGFSPITTSFYQLINNYTSTLKFEYFSILSFSFLFVNILNNYFLMELANEDFKCRKLSFALILHLLCVVFITLLLRHIVSF